jgi:ATP-dependent DNA helicase RecQ
MLDYLATDGCRMRYLRDQLDDPQAVDCGRCDNCGGLALSSDVSEESVGEAAARLARPGVVLEPRRMWPTALSNLGIDLRGRIGEPAEEGRAVARLTDLGHGQSLRRLLGADTPDGPVPVPLVEAVVEVLRDWRPEVDGIVHVESATRPTLTADLAAGLSRFLQVPLLGRWALADPDVLPGQGAANSAQRVAAVGRRFRLDADDVAGRSVLLVDDLVVTGWTLTLAGRALRQAGAERVLPLTLAVQA